MIPCMLTEHNDLAVLSHHGADDTPRQAVGIKEVQSSHALSSRCETSVHTFSRIEEPYWDWSRILAGHGVDILTSCMTEPICT